MPALLNRSLFGLALCLGDLGCNDPEGDSDSGSDGGVASVGMTPEIEEAPVCVGPAAVSEGIAEAVLTPVLFVPAGATLSEEDAERVTQVLANTDGWFSRELDGAALRRAPPVIVEGAYDAAYYLEQNRAWDELAEELPSKLGFGPWSPGHGVLLLAVGFGKFSCGDGNGEAGLAIIGLDALLDRDSCVGAYWCSEAYWTGDVIRDLGYLLTLEESSGDSIMAPWSIGDYIERIFTADERSLALAQPFVAVPVDDDRLPDWQPCASDLECISGRCGCNGWYRPVCLPDKNFPKSCVPEPFCGDALCLGDESCGSCPEDCGVCPPACGDGQCNGEESCQICPVDCGACEPTCGDTICNGDESCNSCEIDCGPCPCPCSADPNIDNFCNFAPKTKGCVMTEAGGYCDPNGDGSYTDADWEHGYYEYFYQCG